MSQRIQFTYVRKSHKPTVYRNILNIKLSSSCNHLASLISTQFRICNKQLSRRNIINLYCGRKSHNSTNCRDIASTNLTTFNSISLLITLRHYIIEHEMEQNEMCLTITFNSESNDYQIFMCQWIWVAIANVTTTVYKSYYYNSKSCQQ